MIEAIHGVINAISGFLYQPYIVPLFLIAAGLYFTVRTGFLQVRLFGESIKVVSEKPKDKRSVSSFGALMVSPASAPAISSAFQPLSASADLAPSSGCG